MTAIERFTTLKGPAAPLLEENLDTDQIVPARFLKYPRSQGYGSFLFYDRKTRPGGVPDPDFVLNRPEYREAPILLAGANFGSGSSREGAVYALVDHGIRCVVAPSFGPIFYKNSVNNGLLPAQVDACDILRLVSGTAAEPVVLTVDLTSSTIRNQADAVAGFRIEPFFRDMLLNGVDEIGLTLEMADRIAGFEKEYHQRFPFMSGEA